MKIFRQTVSHAFVAFPLIVAVSTRAGEPGELDSTFKPDIQNVSSFAVQKDQKIVCVGDFTTVNGFPRSRIARVNPDGTLDKTFLSSSEGANKAVNSVALQADGKILIAGDFDTLNFATRKFLARLNADGTPDKSFLNTVLSSPDARIWNITVLPDKSILVGGGFDSINGSARARLARLHADGTVDDSFNYELEAGWRIAPGVNAIGFQSDGKILVALNVTFDLVPKYQGLLRITPDGAIDQSFTPVPMGSGAIQCVAVQSDDKILIGGFFYIFDGAKMIAQHLLRLNVDGSIDATFKNGVLGSGASFSAIYPSPIGDVLAAGVFTYANVPASQFKVVRLHSDGSLDSTFNALFPREPGQITRYSPGQILLGGPSVGLVRMYFPTEPPPPPHVSSILKVDGKIRFEWDTSGAAKFSVQYKNDFSESAWNVLNSEATVSDAGIASVTDDSAQVRRFYRVVRE